MTNPKPATDAQRPICDKPNCGMELIPVGDERQRTSTGESDAYYCPRSDEEHRLCAQLVERDARIAQQDARLDHLESIGVDAYDQACEMMEKWQRDRRKRGLFPGTSGSLVDGIGWVYKYLSKVEAQLTAEQQAHAATKDELRKADDALIEIAMNDDPSPESAKAYHRALARQQARNAQGAEGGE